jgi:hypothetical protein
VVNVEALYVYMVLGILYKPNDHVCHHLQHHILFTLSPVARLQYIAVATRLYFERINGQTKNTAWTEDIEYKTGVRTSSTGSPLHQFPL